MELELHDAASVRSAEFQDQMAELWDLEGRGDYARRARELATVIRTRVDRVRWWTAALVDQAVERNGGQSARAHS